MIKLFCNKIMHLGTIVNIQLSFENKFDLIIYKLLD